MGNRIYYATQAVDIQGESQRRWWRAKGVQSVGLTTNFNLSQVFTMGQLDIYENIEGIPDVEITMSKVLDGNPLLFHLATVDALTPTLAGRATTRCLVTLGVWDESLVNDTIDSTAAINVCQSSGLYVSRVNYNFPLDDNFMEEITLVGNDKIWKNDTAILNPVDSGRAGNLSMTDEPEYGPASNAGVSRRENMIFDTVDVSGWEVTLLPTHIPGIATNGTNPSVNGVRAAHIGNITVSCDIGREAINEQGRRTPYCRYATFPLQVTTEIEVVTTSGDNISATEGGVRNTTPTSQCSANLNLVDQKIRIATCDGLRLYTGDKNKLSSVNYRGGDTGGGNVTVSYSYSTFNKLTVLHSSETGLTYAGNHPSYGNGTTGWWTSETGLGDTSRSGYLNN